MSTGLLYHNDYLKHETGVMHPENPQRLFVIMKALKEAQWFSGLQLFQPESYDLKWIQTIHSENYIRRVKKSCLDGASTLDCPDVAICRASFEVACLAVNGCLTFADALMRGDIANGFAAVRPPGHHAGNHAAMGFCLFNNIAILARYLQNYYHLKKVFILDWDVHHGNGTQHAFEEDANVYYASLHQYPFYPGSGHESERGQKEGLGTTLNIPMDAGAGDTEYKDAFEKKVLPAIGKFHPDIILISAGFDAHKDDPLAEICLSTDMFGWMTDVICQKAEELCEGRILSVLEGGYNLDVLGACVSAHVNMLQNRS